MSGVCAKVVNIALDLYMKIYAVPPVVDGVMTIVCSYYVPDVPEQA